MRAIPMAPPHAPVLGVIEGGKKQPCQPAPYPMAVADDEHVIEGWSIAQLRIEGHMRWWLCLPSEPVAALDSKEVAEGLLVELQIAGMLREAVDELEGVLSVMVERELQKGRGGRRLEPPAAAFRVRLTADALARVGGTMQCPTLPRLSCDRCHSEWRPKWVEGRLEQGWWKCPTECNQPK